MINDVNELVFCKDDYNDEFEWKKVINNAIFMLMDAGYVSVVRYDDKGLGIVVIEYNYANREYGDTYPCWLYPEEEDLVEDYRKDRDNKDNNIEDECEY